MPRYSGKDWFKRRRPGEPLRSLYYGAKETFVPPSVEGVIDLVEISADEEDREGHPFAAMVHRAIAVGLRAGRFTGRIDPSSRPARRARKRACAGASFHGIKN